MRARDLLAPEIKRGNSLTCLDPGDGVFGCNSKYLPRSRKDESRFHSPCRGSVEVGTRGSTRETGSDESTKRRNGAADGNTLGENTRARLLRKRRAVRARRLSKRNVNPFGSRRPRRRLRSVCLRNSDAPELGLGNAEVTRDDDGISYIRARIPSRSIVAPRFGADLIATSSRAKRAEPRSRNFFPYRRSRRNGEFFFSSTGSTCRSISRC